MKKLCGLTVIFAVMVVAGMRALAGGEDGSSSEAAVRAAVQHYIDGAATGKEEEFNTAWDVQAGHMKFVRKGDDGKEFVYVVPIADAIKHWCAAPPAESWGKITDVSIVDDKMAHVKVEMLWQGTIWVDYLSLLKVNGDWKIVSKLFVSRGKPQE